MKRAITTIKDLRKELSEILEHYDPFNWEEYGWEYDQYLDEFTEQFLELIREDYDFEWGDDFPEIEDWGWLYIENNVEGKMHEDAKG